MIRYRRVISGIISSALIVQPMAQTVIGLRAIAGLAIAGVSAKVAAAPPAPEPWGATTPMSPEQEASVQAGRADGTTMLFGAGVSGEEGQLIYQAPDGSVRNESIQSYFTQSGANDIQQDLEQRAGNAAELEAFVQSEAAGLANGNSAQAQAAQSINAFINAGIAPTTRSDVIWAPSSAVLTGEDPQGNFTGCTNVGAGATQGTLQSCERDYRSQGGGSCTVTHSYGADSIDVTVTGSGAVMDCGEGCRLITVGRQDNNYYTGTCTLYEEEAQVTIRPSRLLDRVTLSQVGYDDHIQVLVGGDVVFSAPFATFPPDNPGGPPASCERGSSPRVSPDLDLTSYFASGDTVTVKVRTAVGGNGEGFINLRAEFSQESGVTLDEWSVPQNCASLLTDPLPQGCTLTQECLEGPADPAVPCVFVNNQQVCAADLQASPIPGIPKLCRRYRIARSCHNDQCQTLRDDPTCALRTTECATANPNNQNECFTYRDTYECGVDRDYTSACNPDVQALLDPSFTNCTTTETQTTTERTVHLEDLRSCDRLQRLTSCEVQRDLRVANTTQTQALDVTGCATTNISVPINDVSHILGATMAVNANSAALTATVSEQPSEANSWTGQVRVEPLDPATCPPGATLTGNAVVTIENLGESESHFPAEPQNNPCIKQTDGFSTLTWQCLDNSEQQVGGYTVGADQRAMLAELFPGEVDAQPCMRARVDYDSSNFTLGELGCYRDAAGVEHCPENTTGTVDSCADLQARPECRFVRTTCTGGTVPNSSFCYAQEDIYDCGTDEPIALTSTTKEYNCSGPIRCMGHECVEVQSETNEDYVAAATAMNAVEFTAMDMKCGPEKGSNAQVTVRWQMPTQRANGDPLTPDEIAGYKIYWTDAGGIFEDSVYVAGAATLQASIGGLTSGDKQFVVTTLDTEGLESAFSGTVNVAISEQRAGDRNECTVFRGENMTCKKALGGWVDCCNLPVGVSLTDYIFLVKTTWDVANKSGAMEMLAAAGLDVPGAWSAALNMGKSAVSTVTEPFISAWDHMVTKLAGTAPAQQAAGQVTTTVALDEVKQQVVQHTAEFLAENMGLGYDAVSQLFATSTATYAQDGTMASAEFTGELTTAATEAIGTIMTAYMVYVALDIIVHLIWECTDDEYELAAKRELRSCADKGSYCANDTVFGCIERRQSFCCYSSPLARIIQEQARPQLGIPVGDARSPHCEGLTIAEMSALDFSQINLDEWTALLQRADVISDGTTVATDYARDNLTRENFVDGTSSVTTQEEVEAYMEEAGDPAPTKDATRDTLWTQ